MTKKILKNAAIMLASLLLSYGVSFLLQNVFDIGEHINSVFIFAVFTVSPPPGGMPIIGIV